MTDKTDLPKVIYLIPDGGGYVWCEDPAPGVGMEEKDAVKYLSTEAFIEQVIGVIHRTTFKHGHITDSGMKMLPEDRLIKAILGRFEGEK